MRRLILLPLALVVLAFAPTKDEYFGKRITAKDAVAATDLVARLEGKESLEIKVEGPISAVCQKKGCWITMQVGAADPMMIRFKDYAFFLPKDAAGRTAILQGVARYEVLSEADRRHYAQDAGKTAAEIEQIKGDSKRLTFEAEGVILKGK